jgi:hypothetical protein
MKTDKMIVVTIVLLGFYSMLNAQNTCKVLKPEISASYTGSCKQGLAEGLGKATGDDYYEGNFVKGLPDGKGTYVWKNGATYTGEWKKGLRNGNGTYSFLSVKKDSILAGKWKNDIYLGNPAVEQYTVDYRNNIGRVSFIRVGDRPYVRYKFSRNGSESLNISNLLMQGSSGSENTSPSFTGFEEVSFPFKGKVSFVAPSSFMTTLINCEVRLTINEPGAWQVTIFY